MIEANIEGTGSMFVFPSFKHEEGEIERVQAHFQINTENFVQKFLERALQEKLVKLTDDVWDTLENTDSNPSNLARGDWDAVAEHCNAHEVKRDWQSLKTKMQGGIQLDAPVIARRGRVLHLLSGNTRLMIARALGKRPEVLIVDITDFQ